MDLWVKVTTILVDIFKEDLLKVFFDIEYRLWEYLCHCIHF